MQSPFIEVTEIALRLSVSPGKVRRMLAAGEIPATDIGTQGRKAWRVKRSDFEAWLAGAPTASANPEIDRLLAGFAGLLQGRFRVTLLIEPVAEVKVNGRKEYAR